MDDAICPATVILYGHLYDCGLPVGHQGMHEDVVGNMGWMAIREPRMRDGTDQE